MTEPFGVYVHVPFCAARCDYCAFATYTDRDHLMVRYVDACVAELGAAARRGELPAATTVFVGGGTPSRLAPDELGRLLEAVPRRAGAEVTVECNPEDADERRFAVYRAAGVTRLSFGIQSTRRHVLDSLGRRPVADAARRCAELAAAGFASFNMDLIFGAAAETDDDWAGVLADVLGLETPPPHVSAYALTVEPGTPLAAAPDRHPDDDTSARRYEMADAALAAAGYRWEEVSNWARPGHECRHNQLYWSGGDYLGVGSAAHSHRDGRRWWNVRTPERYVAAVEEGRAAVAAEEVLTPDERRFERLVLSLRTPAGVPDASLPDHPELAGLVERRHGRAVLTVRGRLLANELSTRLVPTAPDIPRRGRRGRPVSCAP
ncbi:MAG TPA: radical SAM family heme chaperone HemW [Acidimicrobiales bacterium]|nr:radical SAM family heme chaperone HemW [Acidimicrobiales bacterium]